MSLPQAKFKLIESQMAKFCLKISILPVDEVRSFFSAEKNE